MRGHQLSQAPGVVDFAFHDVSSSPKSLLREGLIENAPQGANPEVARYTGVERRGADVFVAHLLLDEVKLRTLRRGSVRLIHLVQYAVVKLT